MTWKRCALGLALILAASTRPGRGQGLWERWPAADRLFESSGPWTGADAAYTVDIGGERILWLFGDTFVGRVRGNRRIGVHMVRNTVGVQTGRDPARARIEFFLGPGPAGVFAPPGGRGWMWPLDGVRTPRGLAIFLGQFADTGDGSAFGFRACGNALALIGNPGDAPARWRPRILELPFGSYAAGGQRAFGIAVTPSGPTLYIWGYRDLMRGGSLRRTAVLARAPVASPERLDRWRFWDGARWTRDPARTAPLFEECATELSVHGAGPAGGPPYVALYTRNGLSADILLRTAPALTGPWSAARVIYRCPEARPGVFTYAAKAHPELASRPGEIVATYLTNAGDLGTVVGDARLYRPLFLKGRAGSRVPASASRSR